eukprot:scaffold1462_cov260-Pinguiococcus_pyrenoidosus.AAC.2
MPRPPPPPRLHSRPEVPHGRQRHGQGHCPRHIELHLGGRGRLRRAGERERAHQPLDWGYFLLEPVRPEVPEARRWHSDRPRGSSGDLCERRCSSAIQLRLSAPLSSDDEGNRRGATEVRKTRQHAVDVHIPFQPPTLSSPRIPS